ncbi:unnamed protein product [Echinostoma caproni]|uniref:Uncharacterized protein n=1 Tax=Echinostoma caproni TaxID=27848 RepID=A0A183AJ98_9TREM|nr:unnamed protein product [Echinostoma caproni]
MLRQPDVSKRFRETTCNLNNEKQINTNTLVKLPGLWRMTTQTNLLAYGYRTVAQARRFRSSSAHSMRIQRSETMPCVKSIASNVATGRACALPIRPCESLEILASRSIEHDSRGT